MSFTPAQSFLTSSYIGKPLDLHVGSVQTDYGTMRVSTVTSITGAAALTGLQVIQGLILLTLSASVNVQLPTAADLANSMAGSLLVGTTIKCKVINNSGAANTGTITTNTGMTISGVGAGIAQNVAHDLLFVCTNAATPAFTCYIC